MEMSAAYWPWWAGAAGLVLVAAGHWLVLRKPLGVSGHWERLVAGVCGLSSGEGKGEGFSFLAGVFLGGLAAVLLSGGWRFQAEVGALFTATFGRGPAGWAVLFVGGALVGYGTRWADGCTSGHGLMGCSRGQRGSLIATAVFFGAAAATAFALKAARP